LALFLTLLLFTSCGSGGDDAGGTVDPPSTTQDNWDEMKWDEGEWQ
jgi:hypothetical protein